MTSRSEELMTRAAGLMPGGVNSPVRAFGAVGGVPRYIREAAGAYLTDEDGLRYIDYVGSWGPMILGHAYPAVIEAVQQQATKGLSYGATTELELALAEEIQRLLPSMQLMRMVNSGTEATMSALRLARGFTGRNTIVKFEGCYHGHADSLLVKAGSGALTFGVPTSPGVPEALAQHTLTLPYNDVDAVRALFAERGGDIAAIIVEPVAGNMNCIPPLPGFLDTLRELCDGHHSLLIFDEVMTGFRVAQGGAQLLYGVLPDLTCLGKIVGGGMPVGVFGGRRDIMQQLAPEGPVYQAGTLSGNPLAMCAGLATLKALQAPGFYEHLGQQTASLTAGLRAAARQAGIAFSTNEVGGMFGLFFTEQDPVTSFAQVMRCDQERFRQFFHGMLDHGVYLAPSAFEAGFVSAAHGQAEIDATIRAAEAVFADL